MSLVPYILRDLFQAVDKTRIYDQHFGLGLNPQELVSRGLCTDSILNGYLRPWRLGNPDDSGVSKIVNDKDNFKVILDVQLFKPEELSVKIDDDFVVIEGKHEERSDEHGFISRQFTRRYRLPEGVDKQALKSSLSSDGVLELCAPKKDAPVSCERIIPITQTNEAVAPSNKPVRTPLSSPNPPAGKKPKIDPAA